MVRRFFTFVTCAAISFGMLAGCGAPTPEKLCEKAEEKDRSDCASALNKIKTKLDETDKALWGEFAKCAKDKDFKSKSSVKECLKDDKFKKAFSK